MNEILHFLQQPRTQCWILQQRLMVKRSSDISSEQFSFSFELKVKGQNAKEIRFAEKQIFVTLD